jgi:hypothetical protein
MVKENDFMRRLLLSLILLLAGCTLTTSKDTATPVITPTAVLPVETTIPTDVVPTATTIPPQDMPLVYYYFASIPSDTFPAGSIVIVPDVLILSPNVSDIARSDDPATNVRADLQAMINDPRNAWTSSNLMLTNVTVNAGQAVIQLSGEIGGAGDVVLIAARYQFLMTVFAADESIQSVLITSAAGVNIGNWGLSNSSENKASDYAYSRAEIADFMAQNALG